MKKIITICDAAYDVLTTANPDEKAQKTFEYVTYWQNKDITKIGKVALPKRPSRLTIPKLLPATLMPKRAKAGSMKNKIALLHALAHIELNAIDLAWDIVGRDFTLGSFKLPTKFYDDWLKVAKDEAKHYQLLTTRLQELGTNYGDLPAHDGLWESSMKTAGDFAARLAVVPMVLEARGLDVVPSMITNMQKQQDLETAKILQIIHDDEITHVAAGTKWFKAWCLHYNLDTKKHWQQLVCTYFQSNLKRPFNDDSRHKAGLIRDWYEALAD
ncbi:MAG: ferritin-like domain-containing protein [Rickettsiaceae bacterium]|nr:ferritin-like domain-containing protein [Rickettsiaceae bacterium]